jgi:hypothetical protein
VGGLAVRHPVADLSPIVEVLRLSCRQDSAGGALLDDTVQRLLARVRVPVAQQFSTAIRECTTATVEHS